MNGTRRRGPLIALVAILVVAYFVVRVGLGLGALFPDLLVVALLLAAREMSGGWAAGLGLLLGILDGSVVPLSLGASAIVLAVLGYLGARTRTVIPGDSMFMIALYLFAGKWLYDFLIFMVLSVAGHAGPASALLLISPLSALYAAVAGVLALAAYRLFA